MDNSEEEIEFELKKIGLKLRQLRIDKGYSSYETFAYDFNLNRVQYWRIENGQNITIKTLLRILEIHEITLEEFFVKDEPN